MSQSTVERPGAARRPQVGIGLAASFAVALAAGLAAWGTYGESNPETWEFLILLGVIAVAAAVVFGWIVPRGLRQDAAGASALALSVVGLVTVAIFWSGLPPILAVGGILLGWAGRDARRGSGLCRAAVAVGVLAIAADVAAYVQDMAF
jgi:hypothetical protein